MISTTKHNLLLLQKRSFERLLRMQKGLRTLNSQKDRQKGRAECFTTLPNVAGSASSSPHSHQDTSVASLGNFVSQLKLRHKLHPATKLKIKS